MIHSHAAYTTGSAYYLEQESSQHVELSESHISTPEEGSDDSDTEGYCYNDRDIHAHPGTAGIKLDSINIDLRNVTLYQPSLHSKKESPSLLSRANTACTRCCLSLVHRPCLGVSLASLAIAVVVGGSILLYSHFS